MLAKISLEKMRFYAYPGVAAQERTVGNWFEVDVSVWVDCSAAMRSDCVDDTLNYAELYDTLRNEMIVPSNLLEHCVGRMINAVLERFPQVEQVLLRLAKTPPPIRGKVGSAAVEMCVNRMDING